eukprot:scaffold1940_cov112-Isochrysis_galbana.AAC.8
MVTDDDAGFSHSRCMAFFCSELFLAAIAIIVRYRSRPVMADRWTAREDGTPQITVLVAGATGARAGAQSHLRRALFGAGRADSLRARFRVHVILHRRQDELSGRHRSFNRVRGFLFVFFFACRKKGESASHHSRTPPPIDHVTPNETSGGARVIDRRWSPARGYYNQQLMRSTMYEPT